MKLSDVLKHKRTIHHYIKTAHVAIQSFKEFTELSRPEAREKSAVVFIMYIFLVFEGPQN